jgi:hypothetical protein
MLGSSCSPCCGGCACTEQVFNKLAASSVTLTLSSPVPNQVELTYGEYKIFGNSVASGQTPPNPYTFTLQYTAYKSSDFYKTYSLALNANASSFTCSKNNSGGYSNSATVVFGYSDNSVSLTCYMVLFPKNANGSAPMFPTLGGYQTGYPMQKIGDTDCYFAAYFFGTLYDKVKEFDYGVLLDPMSWNKTTRDDPAINADPPARQQVWTISPEQRAVCAPNDANSSYRQFGFWDQNYAASGAQFAKTQYARLSANTLADAQMTSSSLQDGFPSSATCVVKMRRDAPTRFWTTGSQSLAFCNGYYQTDTKAGQDSSDSTATGVIQITPP